MIQVTMSDQVREILKQLNDCNVMIERLEFHLKSEYADRAKLIAKLQFAQEQEERMKRSGIGGTA